MNDGSFSSMGSRYSGNKIPMSVMRLKLIDYLVKIGKRTSNKHRLFMNVFCIFCLKVDLHI